jgi:hypothetical protein
MSRSQPSPPPTGQPRKAVTKKRGLSDGFHGFHLIMTICTCGAWGIVWICWWLFRLIVPKRNVTRYYER